MLLLWEIIKFPVRPEHIVKIFHIKCTLIYKQRSVACCSR
ncbi:Uncharacterized protein dnm_016140 [Desulfonema magnum]|uniref:Uncharacterized protein n=1 Tax=Desulfonema magnum TaxID=45655 RepID=A0A975GM91_9BACT|nr:Uncharacterized protein dnm_016140 [Desulfonema magnum]